MQTRYTHIHFAPYANGSTWLCLTNRAGDLLGTVELYQPWQEHCFYPEPGTLYSAGCLDDVAHFLRQLNGK